MQRHAAPASRLSVGDWAGPVKCGEGIRPGTSVLQAGEGPPMHPYIPPMHPYIPHARLSHASHDTAQ